MTERQQTARRSMKKWIVIPLIYLIIILASFLFVRVVTAPIAIRKVEAHELSDSKIDFVTPELKAICACESVGDWNAEPIHIKNGKVLRGKVTPEDVGVCQINERYHLAASKRMGLNIYSWAGNVAYANYLYVTQGTKPWAASRKCWDK